MWSQMVQRGDGMLVSRSRPWSSEARWCDVPMHSANHPDAQDTLRRIFTLKLATVRKHAEPTGHRARRSEFSDEEWRLVTDDYSHAPA